MPANKKRSPRGNRRRTGTRSRDSGWSQLSEDELLDVRFCDLGLTIQGTPLMERIDTLNDELAARSLRFRPHYWLAEEWFSPDEVPGIAIPFYLAHPRLVRLERKMMLEVEGGTRRWCLRLLRHEAGHAIDTAFRLRRRKRWRQAFGAATRPYPDSYRPRPYSKRYVLHLSLWYAQAHPCGDFAETFAVWLKPRSRWRTEYQSWPALRKLGYVDELMAGIRDRTAPVRSRKHIDPISNSRKTLREHYDEKRERYAGESPHFHDTELLRLFSDAPEHGHRPRAAAFLRKHAPELRRVVCFWTGQSQYTIHQVLREMIQRCQEMGLRVDRPAGLTKRDALVMLAVQTLNYLHTGHYRIAV